MMNVQVCSKEKLYSALMTIVSALFYGALYFAPSMWKALYTSAHIVIFWILILFVLYSALLLVGNLRNNAVRVSPLQFPELFAILKKQSEKLGLKKVPAMYILQSGGLLNAFATKLWGGSYVILYSDIVDAAYQEGMPAVEFIIGHELGHIARKHVNGLWNWFILPAKFIPFLSSAYSRAREFTCDSIGYALCPEGAEKGLLVLAAGKRLHKKINVDELIWNYHQEKGFISWYDEIVSTHPPLIKRIERFHAVTQDTAPSIHADIHKSFDNKENSL